MVRSFYISRAECNFYHDEFCDDSAIRSYNVDEETKIRKIMEFTREKI